VVDVDDPLHREKLSELVTKVGSLTASVVASGSPNRDAGLVERASTLDGLEQLAVAETSHGLVPGIITACAQHLHLAHPPGGEHGFTAGIDRGVDGLDAWIEHQHEQLDALARWVTSANSADWLTMALAQPQRSQGPDGVVGVDRVRSLGIALDELTMDGASLARLAGHPPCLELASLRVPVIGAARL
jgi:hypothetical protein